MDEPIQNELEGDRCSACGSPLPADATSCLACGSAVVTNAAIHPTPDIPSPAPIMETRPWQTLGGDTASQQLDAPLAPGERRCQWCDTISPAGADRCIQCKAAFPDPARDAALLAEAQQRLTIIEHELDAKKRSRWFWGLFS